MIWLWKRGSRLAGGFAIVAVVATASIPEIRFTATTLSGAVANALTIAHILGALVWIGGLVVLAVAGLMSRRETRHLDVDDARAAVVSDEWRRIWERFSVVALYAVGALIVSGSWLAWTHVGTPTQLFTTPYGRYLALKLCVVALLLAAGAYNTRVLIPAIRSARRDGDTRSALQLAAHHFPLVAAGESLLTTAILAIVPFLRGSARAEANWPSASSFDLGVFATGLVLVAMVAAVLWAGTRIPGGGLQVKRRSSPVEAERRLEEAQF